MRTSHRKEQVFTWVGRMLWDIKYVKGGAERRQPHTRKLGQALKKYH